MKFQAKLVLILTVSALSLAALPACAKKSPVDKALVCKDSKDCPYFPEVYKGDRAFKQAFLSEIKKVGIKLPRWMPNGVSSPIAPVAFNFNGGTRLLGSVCEPHRCGEHRFVVLYDAQEKSMTGIYVSRSAKGELSKAYFGDPGMAEMEILQKE